MSALVGVCLLSVSETPGKFRCMSDAALLRAALRQLRGTQIMTTRLSCNHHPMITSEADFRLSIQKFR
ncbi:hypothetical protein ACGF5C_05415 [Micromonospora sp. NPDC047620]|uniref:hypothetical protein n=1 Tax=Micromonospora sp. NPDC047620 TaxID=3364251 RepID=UPI0037242C8F